MWICSGSNRIKRMVGKLYRPWYISYGRPDCTEAGDSLLLCKAVLIWRCPAMHLIEFWSLLGPHGIFIELVNATQSMHGLADGKTEQGYYMMASYLFWRLFGVPRCFYTCFFSFLFSLVHFLGLQLMGGPSKNYLFISCNGRCTMIIVSGWEVKHTNMFYTIKCVCGEDIKVIT